MLKILTAALCLASPVFAQTYSGAARVVDGDTIDLGLDANIRLHGIDAPERAQKCGGTPCGEIAREWLAQKVDGQQLRCEQVDWDSRYKRPVARCTLRGEDIGRMMVQRGYARAYLKYATDYALDEKTAALNKTGFWANDFDKPADFRAAKTVVAQQPGCVVKGNISPNSGEKIYHVEGQRHYAKVRINTGKGEACFADEAEAQAAGWRKARS